MPSSKTGAATPRRRPRHLARLGDRLAWYASAVGLERWARLVAVAITPLLLPDQSLADHAGLFSGLAAYVLVTALAPRNRYLRASDLLAAAAVIGLAGTEVVSFLPFLLVAVAGPASRGGPRAGAAAGLTLSLLLLVRLAVSDVDVALDPVNTVSIALLLPLTGLTTAAAAQVLDDRAVHDRMVLHEANRLLTALRSLASDLPGGLDTSTVCAALVAETRGLPASGQVVVYADDRGVFRPVATSGVPSMLLPKLRVDVLRDLVATGSGPHDPAELPAQLHRALEGQPHWMVVPIGAMDDLAAVLLAGFDEAGAAARAEARLLTIADDGAVALDNVRLFDGTLERAADAARRQVAADLHDGVAQALAHLRLELELLALARGGEASDGPDSDEVERLARVATSALDDLRRTIEGLRAPASGGIADRLARHLDDVRTPHGPQLHLDATVVELDPDRAEQVLRITQEAVSNALRHADATDVVVSLHQEGGEVSLRVEDDGVGRSAPTPHRGNGIGVRTMRERAHRLRGSLDLHDRPGGGTVVALRFPLQDPVTPNPR